ncbi:hypothetical protein F0562_024888 [Nyssa sinensis]|uniref:Uncharacterized protein n=1 Tax=Nyssa sinensis TaxID=561372 RepID=A0A5J5BE46_9ASTE|nr:hypothetical protein F0562_024888 [Nyssa sinensis]
MRRMKRGKDDQKLMGPLFPRVHINDLQKGGQRAPPRNKMALYEDLSFHSQRFTSGSAWLPPLPPNNCCNLVSSMLSSQCGDQESSSCFPNSLASPHLAEKLHSYSCLNQNRRQHLRKETDENPKVSKNSQVSAAYPASILSNGCASSSPFSLEKISEQFKGEKACLTQKQSNSWADDLSSLEIVSCSTASLGESHNSPDRPENVNEFHEDPGSGSSRVEDVDRNGDFSDISRVDSIFTFGCIP